MSIDWSRASHTREEPQTAPADSDSQCTTKVRESTRTNCDRTGRLQRLLIFSRILQRRGTVHWSRIARSGSRKSMLQFPMIASTIRERLARDPFEPFLIRASSGQGVLVASPDLVVLMKSEVFIAAPNSDRWAQIPYLHVAGVENAPNGHTGRSRGKRRR